MTQHYLLTFSSSSSNCQDTFALSIRLKFVQEFYPNTNNILCLLRFVSKTVWVSATKSHGIGHQGGASFTLNYYV